MAGEEIKVPIGVPVETNAAAAADSIESFRDVITSANGEIKAMSGTLRQLRGSSDEVKAAKAQLTAKIDAQKSAVSAASLALVKHGTSYDAAAAKEKKFAEAQKKVGDELKKTAELAKKDAEGKVVRSGKVLDFNAPKRVAGPKTPNKTDLLYAENLLKLDDATFAQAITALKSQNPGLEIEEDDNGKPTAEGLAWALKANRDNAIKRANAFMPPIPAAA